MEITSLVSNLNVHVDYYHVACNLSLSNKTLLEKASSVFMYSYLIPQNIITTPLVDHERQVLL